VNLVKNLILVTGAVRSGKSTFAEKLAGANSQPVIYIATMPDIPGDEEQLRRINRHKQRRPADWKTIESSLELAETVRGLPNSPLTCLIDCLSLYVTNLLLESDPQGSRPPTPEEEDEVLAKVDTLLQALAAQGHIRFIVVSNEVGWGVVPETPLGRSFRDILGVTNQRFAAAANEVWLTCAGLPLRLKPQTTT
jgi:adenosylcobinamide kinase / adenosylcobinamide-phosphate guanylyltransferase